MTKERDTGVMASVEGVLIAKSEILEEDYVEAGQARR